MSWFKTILLLGVLCMTWVDCGRRPTEYTRAWPDAAFEPPSTNVMRAPGAFVVPGGRYKLVQSPAGVP